jgi:hypothetical protein
MTPGPEHVRRRTLRLVLDVTVLDDADDVEVADAILDELAGAELPASWEAAGVFSIDGVDVR